jgi:CubicO group peptidase (beta-lactamase class C family)
MSPSEKLDRLLQAQQADRLPSVSAAVVRKGELVWANAVGSADYDDECGATPQTQYRIGSITKTFTAVAVMQLYAEGRLDLDDRLEQHLDVPALGTPTLRRLLCHLSGLQREVGEMWVDDTSPTEEELIASLTRLEAVLPPARAHHYSNLAFALLGQVVAQRSGLGYRQYVDDRIMGPLGLSRTTWEPEPPRAQGYLVSEYARTVWQEKDYEVGAAASAAQLWSTVEDLARWATFLAEGDDAVLAGDVVEEMWFPQVMYYPHDWILGWGLGLQLFNRHGRIWGGHGGAMPGHLAGVFVDRKTGVGAAAVTNSGTRGDMEEFAISLAAEALELWPEPIEQWRPEQEPPADVVPLLGRWWSEGNEFVFWWEKSALQAKWVGSARGRGETTFERDGEGWRASAGRERGERLRREGDGLVWAGYWFTRDQRPFSS